MIVNIPLELGYGLTEHVESFNCCLYQRGSVWYLEGAETQEQAQLLIDTYNPWPVEKAKKLVEINQSFVEAVEALTAGVTQAEKDSWEIQQREANSYPNDCPNITILANSRGIPLDSLVAKIKDKSELYATNYFMLQGMRDKLEDTIKSYPNSGQHELLPSLMALVYVWR